MGLKEFAELGEALSMVVAALALCFAVYERRTREKDRRILEWQRVVVYGLIDSGATTFNDLKVRYVTAASQFQDVEIPKGNIQDSALRLVLLALIRDRLVSQSSPDNFIVNTVSLEETRAKQAVYQNHERVATLGKLLSQAHDFLDERDGGTQIEELFRKLKAAELGIAFHDFHNMIRYHANLGTFILDSGGLLWAKHKFRSTRAHSESAFTRTIVPPSAVTIEQLRPTPPAGS